MIFCNNCCEISQEKLREVIRTNWSLYNLYFILQLRKKNPDDQCNFKLQTITTNAV